MQIDIYIYIAYVDACCILHEIRRVVFPPDKIKDAILNCTHRNAVTAMHYYYDYYYYYDLLV